jgi:sRNA-binding protein
VEGANRVDLDGISSGIVTAQEAEHAKKQLAELDIAAPPPKQQRLQSN